MKNIFVITFFLLLLSFTVKSQKADSSNPVSLEFGFGYNTLGWEVTSLQSNISHSRNQLFILPSFKIRYSFPLTEFKNHTTFGLSPFVGYNMFGGKSKTESSGYKDVIILQAFETGVSPCFSFSNHIAIYGGVKGQYIFHAQQRSFGSVWNPAGEERKWESHNVNEMFRDVSFSAGLGFNYWVNRFSVGIESWFGISNLGGYKELKIDENNYRFVIGYRIGQKNTEK
jgi:hypothetical protein